jgi:hypothetical protein
MPPLAATEKNEKRTNQGIEKYSTLSNVGIFGIEGVKIDGLSMNGALLFCHTSYSVGEPVLTFINADLYRLPNMTIPT